MSSGFDPRRQGGPFSPSVPLTPGGSADPNRVAFARMSPSSPNRTPNWPPPPPPESPAVEQVFYSTGGLFPAQGGGTSPCTPPPPPPPMQSSPNARNKAFPIPPPPPAGSQGMTSPGGGYNTSAPQFQLPPPPPMSTSPGGGGGYNACSPQFSIPPPPPPMGSPGGGYNPSSPQFPVPPPPPPQGHGMSSPGAGYNANPAQFQVPPPPPPPPTGGGGCGPLPPPPPPPPPPPSGGPTWRQKQAAPGGFDPSQVAAAALDSSAQSLSNLPPQLHGTLAKDKKPFTYTPGGLDLSEIKSPRIQRRINERQQAAAAHGDGWGDPPRRQAGGNEGHSPQAQLSRQMDGLNLDGTPQHDRYADPNRSQSLPRSQAGFRSPDPGDGGRDFVQSKSFRVLQKITDTDSPDYEPPPPRPREEDEMRFTGLRRDQIPSRSFQVLQKMTGCDDVPQQPYAQYGHPQQYQQEPPQDIREYCNHPEELDDTTVNPRYRGGNIPSRSFKMLQEMTGADGSQLAPSVFQHRQQKQQQQPQQQRPHHQQPSQPGQPKPRKTTQMVIQMGGPSSDQGYMGPMDQGGAVYAPEKVFPQPTVPASMQEAEAEPRKYTGGSIPSRSFRMLQAMTGENPGPNDGSTEY